MSAKDEQSQGAQGHDPDHGPDHDPDHDLGLDEAVRLKYLKAMGISSWSLKRAQPAHTEVAETPVSPPVTSVQEPTLTELDAGPQPVDSALEPMDDAVIDSLVETNPAGDISSLDWQQLQTTISQCQLCELHTSRSQTVFGVGNPQADLMIIGEAPGADEDRQGEPFVGRAGQLLDAMLKAIELDRQTVFIANVLKCRPPDNRNPHTSEIICCDPYLQRQIELLQPKLILALGRIAAHHLLVSQDTLASLRGQQYSYHGIPLIVSYHPAYLLRKPVDKRKSWQDLLKVKQTLNSM